MPEVGYSLKPLGLVEVIELDQLLSHSRNQLPKADYQAY
jgi:hypothetical protein